MNQADLGASLDVSAMAVSRWERNLGYPTATHLIRLGNLAHKDADNCWFFWNLAGFTISDVLRVLPIGKNRLRRVNPVIKIVNAGAKKIRKAAEQELVAIPFLRVVAAAGKEQGSSDHDLHGGQPEHLIAAPRLWCPHPAHTVSLRVKGNSMEPTLLDGYIIVVDQAQTDRKKLNRDMVVAHHDRFGLVVSRFWQLKKSEALVSDNRIHDPVPWSSAWRMVGKVLWWIGEPASVAS